MGLSHIKICFMLKHVASAISRPADGPTYPHTLSMSQCIVLHAFVYNLLLTGKGMQAGIIADCLVLQRQHVSCWCCRRAA